MERRMATMGDLDQVMFLIQQAKAYLKSKGVDQWQKGYPDIAAIAADIKAGNGYVLTAGDKVIGYSCISFDAEECYASIQGQWKSIRPYAVVHRMAVDNQYKGQGLASEFLKYTEQLCRERAVRSIKIDTDENNAAMKHILAKNGFEYCGVIRFDNSNKIAYEKLL